MKKTANNKKWHHLQFRANISVKKKTRLQKWIPGQKRHSIDALNDKFAVFTQYCDRPLRRRCFTAPCRLIFQNSPSNLYLPPFSLINIDKV